MKRSVLISDLREQDIRPRELFDEYLEVARAEALAEFANRSELVDVDCPGCAAAERVPAFEKDGFAYHVCRRCETLYASPRPDERRLREFHARSRAGRFWADRFLAETGEARRETIFRQRADWLAGLVDEYLPGAASAADVNAGFGYCLEELDRLGRFDDLVAVEYREHLAEVCRAKGFRVLGAPLEQGELRAERVDVVTAFEVVEELFSPASFVAGAREALRPGGLLLLTTLTVSGFDIRILWESSRNVYPPQHINILSVEGIESLLVEAGFEVLELSTPGQLDVSIVADAVADGVPVDRFVSYLLRHRGARAQRSLQEFLQQHRLSSQLRVAARKAPA